MANTSTMSLPRIEKTVPIYAPPDDSIVLRLSNDFDDIIEKIGSLRLARDHEVGNQQDSVIDLFDRKTRDPTERSSVDRRSNLSDVVECGISNSVDDEDKDSTDADDDSDDDSEDDKDDKEVNGNDDSVDREQGHLVERGPIKSQFPSTNREPPYWSTNKRAPYLGTNETFTFDFDKTAEQILRNKEYSEKLNACLEQLQDAVRTVCESWSNKDQSAGSESTLYNSDNQPAFASTAVANDPSEDSLLEILSSGALQAAQPQNKFFCPPDATRTWQDSHAASGSESRGSSPTCSPASATRAESPRSMRPNFTYSPIGSPQVAAMKYRPLNQTLSSSSNSPFSITSSSSNQSYNDNPSPLSIHQVPIDAQIGERLDEDLENFSFWTNGLSNGEASETSKIAENVDAINNIVDIIDNSDLQLFEEFLKGLGEETRHDSSTTKNVANIQPYLNELPNQEPLRDNLLLEQYLARFDGANSNIRSNCNEVTASNSVASNFLSKSNVSYQTHRNVPEITIPDVAVANRIPSDAIVPNYSKNDGSCVAQESNWSTEQKETGAPFDFPSFPLDSSNFSTSTVNAGVAIGVNNAQVPLLEHRQKKSSYEVKSKRDTLEVTRSRIVNPSETSRSQQRRNSDRSIKPWPSLNLPSVRASERLMEGLTEKQVKKAMSNLLKQSVEELAKQDEDGDTMLMCLVGNFDELASKKVYLAPLVNRLSTVKGALSVTNDRGEDALYLAALNCPQFPYVTGYLAATMLSMGIDISQRLYHKRGDTLIHSIAAQGDTHGEVLAELLASKTIQGNPVFDLSKRNYDGRTALHVAIESHDPTTKGIASVAIVGLLLKYGSDPRVKETKCGDTALHMAVSLGCDPALVKVLLTTHASELVNATNYNHNTPLHLAAAVSNSVPLERQREVCLLLIQAGGQTNLSNRQGKTPLALVSPERKETIRRIFYKRL